MKSGELVVWGPNVSREYWNRPEATRLAKILSAEGEVGHRTGDVGSIDAHGAGLVLRPQVTPGGDPVRNALQRRV